MSAGVWYALPLFNKPGYGAYKSVVRADNRKAILQVTVFINTIVRSQTIHCNAQGYPYQQGGCGQILKHHPHIIPEVQVGFVRVALR